MFPFDLDGDGRLDAIERATMETYFYRYLTADDDAILDDEEDLSINDEDTYTFED
ncbi:MAG: hypothetical protein IJP98_05565 [Clostridia bacterium]|nr:hypothetical protein [Clostridia bacterium]